MSNEQEHEPPKWGDVVRYVTDDRDYVGDDRLELQVQFGNNGDWYVSIAPEGRRAIRGVRLSTSGGASFNRPGMTAAVAALYRAMRGENEQQDLDGLPSVAGDYAGTLEDFERAARQCIADIQESFMPDNALVGVLCDAVRIARAAGLKRQRSAELAAILDKEWNAETEAGYGLALIPLCKSIADFAGRQLPEGTDYGVMILVKPLPGQQLGRVIALTTDRERVAPNVAQWAAGVLRDMMDARGGMR